MHWRKAPFTGRVHDYDPLIAWSRRCAVWTSLSHKLNNCYWLLNIDYWPQQIHTTQYQCTKWQTIWKVKHHNTEENFETFGRTRKRIFFDACRIFYASVSINWNDYISFCVCIHSVNYTLVDQEKIGAIARLQCIIVYISECCCHDDHHLIQTPLLGGVWNCVWFTVKPRFYDICIEKPVL